MKSLKLLPLLEFGNVVGQETGESAPNDEKIQRARVRMFFEKLQKNANLMGYLNFTSPIEQAQAIISFSELVGVPKSQVVSLLTTIKKMAQVTP